MTTKATITTEDLLAEYGRLYRERNTIPEGWATAMQVSEAFGITLTTLSGMLRRWESSGGATRRLGNSRIVDVAKFGKWLANQGAK